MTPEPAPTTGRMPESITDDQARALVSDARQVVAREIRRHPIATDYLSEAAVEAHAAGIVLALTQSGHIR